MKYRVLKQNEKWPYSVIHDYGELPIEKIRQMGIELIGDVFDDSEEVESNMKYIEESGSENWACDGYFLDIKAVSK